MVVATEPTSTRRLPAEQEWQQGLLLKDEWANCLTHALGLLLSLIGFAVLIMAPLESGDHWKCLNYAIYGGSMVSMYAASTIYHYLHHPSLKQYFRLLDHCAIYVFIAGTYTPFALLALQGAWGWTIFSFIWGLTGLGIFLKTYFGYRFQRLSTGLYLLMGWLIVAAIEPLMAQLPSEGLYLLLAGGVFYTVGVVFFLLDFRRFFHAIWHLFTLGGTLCHYLAILLYL